MTQLQIDALRSLQSDIHRANIDAGWWDHPEAQARTPVNFAVKLALIHSELSEALEGARKNLMDDKLPHRRMKEVELADAAIRLLDLAGGEDCDLAGAMAEKLEYNAIRADHKIEARQGAFGKKF